MEKVKSVLFIAVFFIVGLLMIFMPDKAKSYAENGIETEVTITEKYGLKTKQYVGVFADESGNVIEAKVIPNATVYVGDVVVGYYMPDDPYTVICYNGSFLRNVLRVVGVLFCVFGGFIVFSIVKGPSNENAQEQNTY